MFKKEALIALLIVPAIIVLGLMFSFAWPVIQQFLR